MITGPADIVVGLVEAEEVAGCQEKAGAKCSKQFAATAEKNARYLSDRQTANRFIAVSVLKK
ncbi:hypothetical protein A2594_02510 [Candidatus Woesebacteria bacterium RIFOXYD1_FULL_41_28]|uniref:Uncharacterized protein n=1 Tax=Candidatus Woesebacteria bacterium RIFOXYD1_FULL_41_28 TaxID=1802550 RepID=A0A1F8DLZ8_9BACT|nr:MAG: hypothetical protein A2594_02510 [Candidatus Woesebacteria bacterium RIFOXYD1_FULL_41_28]